jgi:hypothetical protein
MNLFDNEEFDEYQSEEMDFITIKEADDDTFNIMYIDFIYDELLDEPDFEANPGQVVIAPKVFTKTLTLGKEYIDDQQIKNDFINTICRLSDLNIENKEELYGKFSFTHNDEETIDVNQRNLVRNINNASNLIATEGRVGPGQYFLVSKDNYEKYNLYMITGYLKPIFHDIDDIVIFRKNLIDQPGVVCIKNPMSNKYEIVDIGFYPQKQCAKIKIN